MKTFKDNQGKTWTLSLSHRKSREMAGVLGLDLLRPQDYLQVLDSLSDRLAFVWLMVRDEAVKEKLDEDSFERRLHGVGYAFKASKAFLEELHDFFLRLGQAGPAQMVAACIETMDQAYKEQQRILNEKALSGQ